MRVLSLVNHDLTGVSNRTAEVASTKTTPLLNTTRPKGPFSIQPGRTKRSPALSAKNTSPDRKM